MDNEQKKLTKMSAFQEDLLLMNATQDLTQSERDAINLVLANNSAVGVIGGYYDEDLSISFASYYFLKNLGYEYDEYRDYDYTSNRSFLDIVHKEDRDFFELENFKNVNGRCNFRILSKDGLPFYANAYKSECEDAEGKKQWILSIRVSVESIDLSLANAAERAKEKALEEKVAMTQIVQAMSKLIVRFAIVDLKEDKYTFFDCGNGATYASSGTFTSLREAIDKHLKLFTDTPVVSEMLSPDNLNKILKTLDDSFKFDYEEKDGSHYYNMSVVPMSFENGKLEKFVMLAQDITQTKLVELESQEALREACAAANQANEAKTDFLAHMSHDIRTPMNAIIGMTAIAGAHIDQKERVQDALEKITGASKHLLSLINDLLDMSQIEKGNMTLMEEEFNLSELVDSMISMITPDVEKHHHNFDVAIVNVEHEDVVGDSLKIQQVFTNLMSNAVKYTPDGGNIRLTITEKPTNHNKIGCYEFVFEDNGIGMSEEFQKVIFDPFARAHSKYVSETQGSGLGMAITKNIVNMMNGDIKVESALNQGSKFTVTIFLRLQDTNEDSEYNFNNLSVLVVDDDEICCESTVGTLNSIGMLGEYVTSGKQAISKTVEHHEKADDYFAIIMDWKMPEMDGIETARQIRKQVGRDIPIIMLSAYDYSEIEDEAREAGVDCFIAKPLFKSRLKTVFHQIVQSDENIDEFKDEIEEFNENDFSNKRILLVEDNELNREIAIELLSLTGVSIEVAVNGKEAVDKMLEADEGYYDLILMDIQMPIMNGYEATEEIRTLDKGKNIPIIAMTANAFAEDVIKAKNAGFNEHIAKPINVEKLNEVLKNNFRS